MIVDLHSHFFPAAAATRTSPVQLEDAAGKSVMLRVGGNRFVVPAVLTNPAAQAASAAPSGLDARVLLPPPFVVLYELDGAAGREWARQLNEGIAAVAAAEPERLIGFATVALQSGGAAAAEELRYAVRSLGLRGVEVLTSVCGAGLDATDLAEFWAAAAELDVPVFVHPHYVAGSERMADYHLRNVVGNPTETAHAGARLIYGGVLEQHRRLRVVLSHGGGALPHIVGRMRHAYSVRPEFRCGVGQPDAGIRQLYYDSVVFDSAVLRHVAELVGADRLVVGSDYPFDMAEPRPAEFVAESGLAADEQKAILHAADRIFA